MRSWLIPAAVVLGAVVVVLGARTIHRQNLIEAALSQGGFAPLPEAATVVHVGRTSGHVVESLSLRFSAPPPDLAAWIEASSALAPEAREASSTTDKESYRLDAPPNGSITVLIDRRAGTVEVDRLGWHADAKPPP